MEEWLGSVCSWNLFSTLLPSSNGLLLIKFHWSKPACNQDTTDLEGTCPWHSSKIWSVSSPPALTLSWSWSLFCPGRPEPLQVSLLWVKALCSVVRAAWGPLWDLPPDGAPSLCSSSSWMYPLPLVPRGPPVFVVWKTWNWPMWT